MRPGPLLAHVEELGLGLGDDVRHFERVLFEVLGGLLDRVSAEERVRALQFSVGIALGSGIAILDGSVGVSENAAVVGSEHLVDLGGGPDVEGTLFFVIVTFGRVAVGVFRREEPSVRVTQVAFEVGRDLPADVGKEGRVRDLETLSVGREKLPLIVEHLFVVRNVPVGIDAVAMKAAAKMIAEAPVSHRSKRAHGHVRRPLRVALFLLVEKQMPAEQQSQI